MIALKHRADLGRLLQQRDLLDAAADVGVAEGRTALETLQWGTQKLYLVDLWQHVNGTVGDCGEPDTWHQKNFQKCMKLLEPFGDRIVLLRGWSHEMAPHVPDESLGFVHLDASHDYEWVKLDLESWYPKLKAGGIMAGHDYLAPQYTVKAAVDEFAEQHQLEVGVIPEHQPCDASFWFCKA